MKISEKLYQRIYNTQGRFVSSLNKVSAEKITADLLSEKKPEEQIELLKKYLNNKELRGLKLLEIGSGLGVFNLVSRKKFGINAWGIEPSGEGFADFFEISHQLLRENCLETKNIVCARGEDIPFSDNTFDVVYSTHVLEHVNDPQKTIAEAIRVCKKGGLIQIVTPNFGSFFDGHYACFHPPYQPKWFWKLWIKYLLKRDPEFIDSLRTEINYFSIKKWLKPFLENKSIFIKTWGGEVFKERMAQLDFSEWAGLYKLKKALLLIRRIKIIRILTFFILKTKSFTPIILTIKKK